MSRRLLHRAHFVKIDLRAEPRRLPRRLDSRQTTTDYIYLIRFITLVKSVLSVLATALAGASIL